MKSFSLLWFALFVICRPIHGQDAIEQTIDPEDLTESTLQSLVKAKGSEDYSPVNFAKYEMFVSNSVRMRWEQGTILIAYRGLRNPVTGNMVRWMGSFLPLEMIKAIKLGVQGSWKFDASILSPTFLPIEWLTSSETTTDPLKVDVLVGEVPKVSVFGRTVRLFYAGLRAEPLPGEGMFFAIKDGARAGHVFPGEIHQYPDFNSDEPANPSWPPSTIAKFSLFLENAPGTYNCSLSAKLVFDRCWHLGAKGLSCTEVCEKEKLRDDRDTHLAGEPNADSARRCEKIAHAFGQRFAKAPLTGWEADSSGLGCFLNESRRDPSNAIAQIRYPESANGKGTDYRRFCACK